MIAEGKRHNQALICLARRRSDVIFAMLRNGTFYLALIPHTVDEEDYGYHAHERRRRAPVGRGGHGGPRIASSGPTMPAGRR